MTIMNKYFSIGIPAGDVGIPKIAATPAAMNAILNQVYMWAGIIAVVVIIIAGYIYTTSAGDPAKTKRAKDAILYAVIGLVVIILAFTITQFVIGGATK